MGRFRVSALLPVLGLALLAAGGLSSCKTKKPGQCSSDKDCKPGEKCVAGKCQQCATDKDCKPGHECKEGVCEKKAGYCESTKDCPDGKVCRENMCQDCLTDKECPSGRCERGRCAEAMAGTCRVDDDCKDEEVCKDGRCVPAPSPYTGPSLCNLQPIYFGFDKAVIEPRFQTALEENSKCIQSVKDRKVHLVGHTDPRGTEEYNLALSNRRAQRVKRYLVNLGVGGKRLHVVPKGELEATGSDESGWAKDRRVELVWY